MNAYNKNYEYRSSEVTTVRKVKKLPSKTELF